VPRITIQRGEPAGNDLLLIQLTSRDVTYRHRLQSAWKACEYRSCHSKQRASSGCPGNRWRRVWRTKAVCGSGSVTIVRSSVFPYAAHGAEFLRSCKAINCPKTTDVFFKTSTVFPRHVTVPCPEPVQSIPHPYI